MVIGDATSEKFFGLNATADMMTLDGPACDERFYLDNWKPAASSPAPSASGSVSSDTPSADIEGTWRRTSSSGESYDGSCHNMTWRPPTSSQTPTDYSQQQYGGMSSYPSPSSDSGASWKERAVEQWSADDVTLWICSLMNNQSQVHFPQSVNVAPYLNMRGIDLLQMSSADIQARDPESGMFVFMSLQHHMTTVSVGSPHSYDQRSSPVHSPYSPPQHNVDNSPTAHRSPPIKREPVIMDTFSSKLTSIDFNQLPSFDASVTFSGIKSIGQEHVTVSDMEAWQMKKPQPPPQPASGQQQTGGHNFVFPQPHPMFPPPSMWSTNWMPMLPSPNDSFYPPGAGGNHLWEFIRDLLFDSRYNPALIKWEDREEGVFKFVKSDQVAKLWGKKKNNSAMTYEKLSRAMRYYYRRKILERIDGRRLVYKFGPMATGWKA